LLEYSHIIKTLDEVFATASTYRDFGKWRMNDVLRAWFDAPVWRAQYGVNRMEALRELALLKRDPYFARWIDDFDYLVIRIKSGRLDLDELVRAFERLAQIIEGNRRLREARRMR